MEDVVIYTRVSTEEQVSNFSLREQEAQLRRYCDRKNLNVIRHYQDEGHSAKTFNRPQFRQLIADLEARKIKFSQLVVYKVDRFSRNLAETMDMVEYFKRKKIKVFSLDGELNFSDTNKFFVNLIQAGAAQHDNMMRADRTIGGMRRAVKEGKWPWKAPYGYRNNSITKVIEPVLPEAELVQYCFKTYAEGIYLPEEVRRLAQKSGYSKSLQGLLDMLRNPIYVGKLSLKGYNDEPDGLYDGDHKPLIDEETFIKVQKLLNAKSKVYKKKEIEISNQLRGKLICPLCGKIMTSSKSKGSSGIYVEYYHCQHKHGCKNRFRADRANSDFEDYLDTFQPDTATVQLFSQALIDMYKSKNREKEEQRVKIEAEIEVLDRRMASMTDKLADDDVDISTYKTYKANYESRKNDLVQRHIEITSGDKDLSRFLKFGLGFLAKLGQYYKNAEVANKQKIISSIFPENLIYENNQYRTTKINEIIRLLFSTSKGFRKNKAGKNTRRSSKVAPTRIELVSKV